MSPPEEPSTPENQPAEAAVQDSAANAQPARRGGLDLSDLKIMPDWVSGMGKPAAAPARHYEGKDRPQRCGTKRRRIPRPGPGQVTRP